jgi:NADH:ubiquinone oxidoreductase subunit D
LLAVGCHAMDVGAMTPFFVGFWRKRKANGVLWTRIRRTNACSVF